MIHFFSGFRFKDIFRRDCSIGKGPMDENHVTKRRLFAPTAIDAIARIKAKSRGNNRPVTLKRCK
ncbi:hypothetical protein DUT91_16590 [Phyllobacterium salinisoli]|uniref:Uncharacterized protein n=1 Tax=Phyllobacterium salinisoli TaxID=1899321 RepID=A0A368K1J0_9HYPH|nr:hypothetical protein DUT91_16590 [Phyllobacterium salinisoli]